MATEYKLNYTASEINQKLATVDETKNTLENSYYNSLEIDGMLEQANTSVETSLATKADLVDGKVPIEQLPDDIGEDFAQIQSDFAQTDSTQPDYIKNKIGDKTTVSLNDVYDLASSDNVAEMGSSYSTIYTKCDIPISNTINASIKHKTTGETISLGSCELSPFDFQGSEVIFGSINTTTTFADLATGNVAALEKTNTNPASVVAFMKNYNQTFIIVDISNYADYEFIISYDTEETIKLSNDALNLDSEPTEGSNNPITSGGVYVALGNIDAKIGDIDTAISQLESMIGGAST